MSLHLAPPVAISGMVNRVAAIATLGIHGVIVNRLSMRLARQTALA